MMWFKKHLASIIIVAASIAATACVAYMIACDMKFTKIKNEAEIQALNFNAKVHANNESTIAEKFNMDKEAARATCEENVEFEVKKMQKISLPNDLLKNAVWKYDMKFHTGGSCYGYRNETYATFTYGDKNGYAYTASCDLGNPSVGIIEYDGNIIYTSAATKYFYQNKYTTELISDTLPQIVCYLSDPTKYYYSTDVIVGGSEYDDAPLSLSNNSNQFTLKYIYARDPWNAEVATNDTQRVYNLHNNIELVADINSGYYIKLTNGRLAYYESSIPADVKNVIINNKQFALSSYSQYREGGCGSNYLNISFVSKEELTKIGTLSNGNVVYKYNDNEKVRKYYESIYYPGSSNGDNITFENFVADQPYFIWFDGFGTAIEYRATKFTPAAECGKPVIYLYPTKDMNVLVKVEPNGGFKKTEPAYNNGWNVWATTKSELTNLADGASYPYLFWEGKAYNYAIPDKGFVLKRENVARDMKILLARLGLNEKESNDFMEFWQPKLEVKPYVYVTFVSQEVFDELAPLTVTPKPDKVIRVFMDYTPLDNYMYVAPLKIMTPERAGFTVVEWGGRLR